MRLPELANGWTASGRARLRILFGFWLCLHFLLLTPWSAELFSSAGVLADGGASPYLRLFPNLFALSDAPRFVEAVHVLAALAALALAAGRFDRTAACFLWYVLACEFGRNPLILNPSLPYVGLLLLVHALQPRGAGAGAGLDPRLFALLWITMAAGYTYSAWTKFASPSWIDGTAFARLLENPLARDTSLRGLLAEAPAWTLRLATWGALGLELLFAPLAFLRRARPWIWGAAVLMHLSLIVLVDFADLTAGMLFLHAATFDPAWLRGRDARAPAAGLRVAPAPQGR